MTLTPKSLDQILADFDDRFNRDGPDGIAIMFRSSGNGSTTQRPAQDELREFIRSSFDDLSSTLRHALEALEKVRRMDGTEGRRCGKCDGMRLETHALFCYE